MGGGVIRHKSKLLYQKQSPCFSVGHLCASYFNRKTWDINQYYDKENLKQAQSLVHGKKVATAAARFSTASRFPAKALQHSFTGTSGVSCNPNDEKCQYTSVF